MICYIIRGIPGSGKTTLAKKLADEYFEAYQYFERNGVYEFNPKKLKKAHEDCKYRFEEALKRKVPVVALSNTSTQEWEYAHYYKTAEKYGYSVIVMDVLSGFENIHGVPKDKLREMYKRFEPIYGY